MINNILKSDFCVYGCPSYFVLKLDNVYLPIQFKPLLRWAKTNANKPGKVTKAKHRAEKTLEMIGSGVSSETLKAVKQDLTDYYYTLLQINK